MDITPLFKAGVMAVKLKRKGELQLHGATDADKNRILPRKSSAGAGGAALRDEFAKQAKDVCQKITSLRNLLLENRTAYMRIGQHLKGAEHMTDQQRDLIDRESEKFVTHFTQHLAQMRADWKRAKRKPQQHAHMEAVMELLVNYLRSVQQIYIDQKKYRVQHELETYRLLKLAVDKKKIPVRLGCEQQRESGSKNKRTRHSSSATASSASADASAESADSDIDLSDGWQWESTEEGTSRSAKMKKRQQRSDAQQQQSIDATDDKLTDAKATQAYHSQSPQQVALDEDIQQSQQLVEAAAGATHGSLSPEDVQMFEQENVQLYHELQGVAEEVDLIEKNVVDIAQLQDIFTEKVSLQQHNIERIANAVVGATENVKDANEQIKQAIQRNAGLRVWSLFFLLVMSFALLFLDWYYD